MNLTALALKAYVPRQIKRQKLIALFEATAKALHVCMPDLDHLTFDQCLEKYAVFTNVEVEAGLRAGLDMGKVRRDLYLHAWGLGNELRGRMRLESRQDVLSVGRALYRAIGIDLKGSTDGRVTIRSCFFSRYYSADVCRIMSSLDEGIAAGLSAGGTLTFTRRITEGSACCEGLLDFKGDAQ